MNHHKAIYSITKSIKWLVQCTLANTLCLPESEKACLVWQHFLFLNGSWTFTLNCGDSSHPTGELSSSIAKNQVHVAFKYVRSPCYSE